MKLIVWIGDWAYTFDASAKTITLTGLPTLTASNLVLITNVTDNVIIYNFADPLKWWTIAGNIITLAYDTTTMSNTDDLQIILDVPATFKAWLVDDLTPRVTIATDDVNLSAINLSLKSLSAYTDSTHKSPVDFTVTYTSASTVTLSGLPFTISTGAQIKYIVVRNSSTNISNVYVQGAGGYAFAHSWGVVTAYKDGVVASIFTANDMYEMGLNGQTKSYDPSLDITKTIDQSPDRASYVVDTLVNTTNVAAATNYYPSALGMSMDGFKDLCLSGRLIDADGTIDVTVEVANNPNPATAVFHQIYGYDAEANAVVNTVGCNNSTKTFVWDFDNLNATWFRIKSVTSGATNTVWLFIRRKSL